ncbi:MAG: aminotransferase class IV [Betaproteobacteria bacterium AqS2]|uniref:Aminodeoxychorismate lyase n=1 Tax=Candidatus Amphirhobacter heronislandensis TaxID=1732024 RepID=A0A930UHZ7_9GAMM|nr:aminotransferase class IV [Betaproteobacteria bacterium AqS2]
MNIPGSDVYLNGEWLPRGEARVSAFDRGFIFGDGIYEVIPVYNRKPFLMDRHLERMVDNLAKVKIPDPHGGVEGWAKLVQALVDRQAFENQKLYIQITRGAAPRLHSFPDKAEPTVFMFTDEMMILSDERAKEGFKGVTMPDFRWLRGDIKSISLLAAVLGSEHARQHDATELIFIREGIVTEGASSNVLICKDGQLSSPVTDRRILPGVTVSLAEEVAAKVGMPVEHRDIAEGELRAADEVMITSSGKEIVAIVSLDGKPVGDGKSGPAFAKLWDGYREASGVRG